MFPKSAQKVPNHTNETIPNSTNPLLETLRTQKEKVKNTHIKYKTIPKFEKLERIELFSFSANILTISS